ncbi:TetR/AcrR family transcriptional regulator [Paenibacillus sp. Marseille-Q9583]
MSAADRVKLQAMKLFSLHGYEGTSMESIAGQVGIRKASLYSHFKGKEQLFLAIVDDLVEKNRKVLHQLAEEIEAMSTKEKLYAVFRHLSYYPLEKDQTLEFDFFRRMVFFPPISLKLLLLEKVSVYDQQLKNLLASIFKEGAANRVIRNSNLSDLLAAFICNADGVMMQIHYCSNEEYIRVAQSAWNVFWTGISTSC